MLRTTRDIERASTGGRLLVGFQAAAKFDVEAERYRALLAAGTEVVAWAAGHADGLGLDDLDYRALPADTRRLENQWFLVTDSPEPLAFVSYELGDARTFGIGGAASPGKRFVGFVSDDADVIDLLIRTLLPIGAPPPPAERVVPSASALELVKASDVLLDRPASDAGAGAVVVAVGRGRLPGTRLCEGAQPATSRPRLPCRRGSRADDPPHSERRCGSSRAYRSGRD
jgi:hypothetical protein